jgi:hypothetical protein
MKTRQDILDAARVYHYTPNPDTLQQLLSRIEEYYMPAPDNTCYICGRSDTDNIQEGWGPCVDVTVVVANGEEGYSRITKFVCNDHLVELTDKFAAMGFVSHHHGSTTLLEDRDCPGYAVYGTCPTPKGYGEEDLEL